uniref:Uncharacterized protein n=1 Tax=Panagrolaimus sp. JU765 TaxID=591449 RepID=A0AC34PWV9_9BILA
MSTADAASSEDADLLDNFLTPMPESLRISMIRRTLRLIQKRELGDIFCKYLRLDINVAMTMINSTLNEFFDMYFKNAIIVCKDPEGYIVMAQPQDSSKWGDWNNVITQPIIQSIEDSPVENPEPIISEPVD